MKFSVLPQHTRHDKFLQFEPSFNDFDIQSSSQGYGKVKNSVVKLYEATQMFVMVDDFREIL